MAKHYEAEKVGEIHRLTPRKTDWGAIIGGIFFFFIILAVIGGN